MQTSEPTGQNIYDVIIAGAGPAGATAAYFLGQAGQKVLVLEKADIPRYKPCGGGVSLQFLKQHFPFSFDEVIENRVTAFNYAFWGLIVNVPCDEDVLVMVMRDRFDAHILAHALVEVQPNCAVKRVEELDDRVRVETAQGELFEARYLIGADGANSMVAHSAGLWRKRWTIPALEAEVKVPPDVLKAYSSGPTFIFDQSKFGYLWIFPKAEHLSVGIAAPNPKPGQLQTGLRQVMQSFGISVDDTPMHGHPIPIYSWPKPAATRRILLTGDAAGLVDPLSGEGIRPAIKSGRLAAETILAGRVSDYNRTLFWKMGIYQLTAAPVAGFFYALRFLCLPLGTPNPFATQVVLELLSDRTSVLGLFFWAIATLPVYLALEIAAVVVGRVRGEEKERLFRNKVFPGKY